MKKKAIKRPVVRLDTSNQLDIFSDREFTNPTGPDRGGSESCPVVTFNEPDPAEILLNQVRLDKHLKQSGQTTPLQVRSLLCSLNWQAFEAHYRAGGRPPYSPRAMMGIILLGIMQGISSLRRLEEFARTDLACMWVSGGILPDHSIIGRFIQRHASQLSEEFFDDLTREVLKVTHSSMNTVAGDGTIIEAAASRFSVVKAEALEKALDKAHDRPEGPPDDKTSKRLDTLQEAQDRLKDRQSARQKKGKNADGLRISRHEPEAVVQPQKDKKRFAASYKPSVLANEQRIIVGLGMDASSETSVVAGMLKQAQNQGEVRSVLFDAGYFSETVLDATQACDIELLCPQGCSTDENWDKQSSKRYLKNQFEYDAEQDHYRCPQGNYLSPVSYYKGSDRYMAYTHYGTPACGKCTFKEACTRSPAGRKVKRYHCDDAKDALRRKMQQDDVRERYKKRSAMVEPVFSHLRGQQGLNRFRRKGLKAVALEFTLHAMAYNLSRLVALGEDKADNTLIMRMLITYKRLYACILPLAHHYSKKWQSIQKRAFPSENYSPLTTFDGI